MDAGRSETELRHRTSLGRSVALPKPLRKVKKKMTDKTGDHVRYQKMAERLRFERERRILTPPPSPKPNVA